MSARTVDWPGAVLLLIAAVGAWISHEPRLAAARWYAEVAAYNRSIGTFLRENREALRDRTVAVFGVAGLSPWSNSAGGYLTRLVGSPVAWQVYVPSEDIFYRFGAFPGGRVTVQPETSACDDARKDGGVYLTFDAEGRGSFAQSCEAALQRVHPFPTLDAWGPKTISAAQAAAGFAMYFTGSNLGAAVDVSVSGSALAMVRARQGRLMTTTIPPRSDTERVVRFSVRYRGRTVFEGEVEVAGTP